MPEETVHIKVPYFHEMFCTGRKGGSPYLYPTEYVTLAAYLRFRRIGLEGEFCPACVRRFEEEARRAREATEKTEDPHRDAYVAQKKTCPSGPDAFCFDPTCDACDGKLGKKGGTDA